MQLTYLIKYFCDIEQIINNIQLIYEKSFLDRPVDLQVKAVTWLLSRNWMMISATLVSSQCVVIDVAEEMTVEDPIRRSLTH